MLSRRNYYEAGVNAPTGVIISCTRIFFIILGILYLNAMPIIVWADLTIGFSLGDLYWLRIYGKAISKFLFFGIFVAVVILVQLSGWIEKINSAWEIHDKRTKYGGRNQNKRRPKQVSHISQPSSTSLLEEEDYETETSVTFYADDIFRLTISILCVIILPVLIGFGLHINDPGRDEPWRNTTEGMVLIVLLIQLNMLMSCWIGYQLLSLWVVNIDLVIPVRRPAKVPPPFNEHKQQSERKLPFDENKQQSERKPANDENKQQKSESKPPFDENEQQNDIIPLIDEDEQQNESNGVEDQPFALPTPSLRNGTEVQSPSGSERLPQGRKLIQRSTRKPRV